MPTYTPLKSRIINVWYGVPLSLIPKISLSSLKRIYFTKTPAKQKCLSNVFFITLDIINKQDIHTIWIRMLLRIIKANF